MDMSYAPNKTQTTRGFTLIELMVVLVILGVLASLIAPNILARTDDAKATAAKADIKTIVQALRMYRIDNQRYPTVEQGLSALTSKPPTGPTPAKWQQYIEKLPSDPWGRPYLYRSPGVNAEIEVFTLGSDGQPGGEGADADIGSWQ
jgi:general secretion pathway protein G